MRAIGVIVGVLLLSSTHAGAEEDEPISSPELVEDVEVEGRADDLLGVADSATEGTIGYADLQARPMLRPSEILEAVPGVIVSQHSGAGKANQYYLRGFNLDHGTDFRTTFDGVPVNMPSHGHGQGYTDLNFIIPELVSRESYGKGPYSARHGDFASAGTVDIEMVRVLPRGMVAAAPGTSGYARVLAAGSKEIGHGVLLAAVEGLHDDGPFDLEQDYKKMNGVIRYSRGDGGNGLTLTAMGYDGSWTSTDQIPSRAVEAGTIGRFGFVDPTDAGNSYRYSISGDLKRTSGTALSRLRAYAVAYDLSLFSNFTYFLDDPVNGDQFEQKDRRIVTGLDFAQERPRGAFGAQVRRDDVENGLYATRARRRLSTTREDDIVQWSLGAWGESRRAWTPWFRSTLGLRVDAYRAHVESDLGANSGRADDTIVSPKAALAFGPWGTTELYASYGWGFHSNDARGATITVDPKTGDPVSRVDPLVRTKGADVGVRYAPAERFQGTATAFLLDIDSELIFVGDAGATEAGRPSRRYGIELANFWRPLRWLSADLDLALSRSHFRDDDPAGDRIPGSIESALTGGVAVQGLKGAYGSVRVRFFGPRPLVEDDSVRSDASTLVYLSGGYELARGLRVGLEVFNVFDAAVSDIDYSYASRLQGEAAPVNDVHFHPAEPRTVRLVASWRF